MGKKKEKTPAEQIPLPIEVMEGSAFANGNGGTVQETTKGRMPTPPPFFPPIGPNGFGDSVQPPEDFDVIKELMLPGQTSAELDVRTDLNTVQIIHLTRARFIARRFRSKAQDRFCDDLERYMISHNRKGRKEVVQSMQSAGMGDAERATGTWGRMMQTMRG